MKTKLTIYGLRSLIAVAVLAVGLLMTGSYDPYHELAILSPDRVGATESADLTVPEVEVPDAPEISEHKVPTVETAKVETASTEVEVRTCSISVDADEIETGGDVTVSWETDGFDNFTVNGESVSAADGSKTYTNLTEDTIFKLIAKTDDGKHTCTKSVSVTCLKPVAKECELTLHKKVDKDHAAVGEEVTYIIDIKNTGDAVCTGGGVLIHDVLDTHLTYVRHEINGDISAGYQGTPLYTAHDRTLQFNGHDLEPGEEGTITVIGKIVKPNQCGDFAVENQAKATAYELNNFKDWVHSNHVSTAVDYDCDIPVRPACPYDAKDGRTIIEFNDRIRSDKGDREAYSEKVPTALAAGTYSVKLASWDGYKSRENVTQPMEQWKGLIFNGSDIVTTTNEIRDLEDRVRESFVYEEVNASLTLTSAADAVQASHVYFKGDKTPNSLNPICAVFDKEPEETPAPSCDAFSATPGTVTKGDDVTLSWETTNATRVVIDNGVGDVSDDGTVTVTPLASTTYTMTVFGQNDQKVTCKAPVVVNEPEDTVPQCVSFTGSPTSLPAGGATTTLTWVTDDADTVTLSGVGAVAKNDSLDIFVDAATTFTLTVEDDDGDKNTCQVPITIEPEETPLSCATDVDFTVSDSTVDDGDSVTLSWDASDRIDSLSIDQGIGAVATSGSRSQTVENDITYTMTATAGDKTLTCPVSVNVDDGGGGGGGGGGSSSPRCELELSDTTIDAGDEITISWETSRATEVTLEDDEGNTLFTTDDFLSDEKEDWYDGSLTISPTEDTTYTLIAERGSRDRECEVSVRVGDDGVTVIEDRSEPPLVAGIALSQVPYTGFEAGPILTMLFYLVLMLWALYVAYYIVIRRDELAGSMPGVVTSVRHENGTHLQSQNHPHLFVEAVTPPKPQTESGYRASETAVAFPQNLPIGAAPIGYANQSTDTEETEATETPVEPEKDEAVVAIENQAHGQGALLSSDAIKHLLSVTSEENRREILDCAIAGAKVRFPIEDGWLVLNQERMSVLCTECIAPKEVTETPVSVPTGTGSLAEAVVTGNIAGAYGLIGNRPMLSVADAVSDLDAVYRARKGEEVTVSDMLEADTKKLSDEELKSVIAALTSALDGTYSEEGEAVKMAIMKATKIVG